MVVVERITANDQSAHRTADLDCKRSLIHHDLLAIAMTIMHSHNAQVEWMAHSLRTAKMSVIRSAFDQNRSLDPASAASGVSLKAFDNVDGKQS
jgi:hypothetical protein